MSLSTRNKFPKASRLLLRKEFQVVLSQGTKVVTPGLVVLGKPNESDSSRLGLLVSKKIGNAVIRNRLKRRIREVFRVRSKKTEGYDIVVIARQRLKNMSYQDLERSWTDGQGRLHRKLNSKPHL